MHDKHAVKLITKNISCKRIGDIFPGKSYQKATATIIKPHVNAYWLEVTEKYH